MDNGNPWIRFNWNKTNAITNLKLFDLPFQLIEKYKDPSSNFVFPVLSSQKVNLYLKEIMFECGIDKKITFHTARHMYSCYSLKNRHLYIYFQQQVTI